MPSPPGKRRKRKITASKDPHQFFDQPLAHSVVKGEIISKYFAAWANIIKTRAREKKMVYFDLFAGKGAYGDGTPSTPLLILNKIVADPTLRAQVFTYFRDREAQCVEALRINVAALPGIETLKYAPDIEQATARDSGLDTHFETAHVVPSFMFLDPFGYNGVTVKLIRAILKDWGCDVAFFFCFKRMPGAIMNNLVRPHMDELFGHDRVTELRSILPNLKTPSEKEAVILAALEASLNAIGGRYIQTFRFRSPTGVIIHHLVFVTKNPTAHRIMKGIMAAASSGATENVPNFEFQSNAPQTLIQVDSPIETLMSDLIERFRGRTNITIEDIISAHHYGTPYVEKNYTEALRRLFYDRNSISAVRGPMSPALNPSKRSMPVSNTLISFDKI